MDLSVNALQSLKPRVAPAPVGYMVSLLLAVSTLYKYFLPVALPWYIMQCAFIAVMGLTFCWVFISGELAYCRDSISLTLVMAVPYLAALVQSIFYWILTHAGMTAIRQGVVSMSYQLLLLMMMGCACILLGSRASFYIGAGLCAGNFLIIAGVCLHFGIGNAISQLLSFFLSGGADDNEVSLALEIHDLTFAMGEVLIFLLMYRKGRKKWLFLVLVGICFIIGWKRSAIPGIFLGCAYIFIMRKLDRNKVLNITLVIGICMILMSFGYVVMVYSGLLEYLTDTFGIDMMGRNQMYDWIRSHYWIGLNFMGYGHGYVTVLMKQAILEGTQALNDELTIHSDMLARYIELGFWGSMLWSFLQDIWIFRVLVKKFSVEAGIAYFACYLFCFMTYFTDNTMFYYFINIVLHLLPMTIILKEKEDKMDEAIRKAGWSC